VATFSTSFFAFHPPTAEGCGQLVQPSTSSWKTFGCEYATNGAFFNNVKSNPSGASLCIGNLVADGKVWQIPTDGSGTKRANFGITKNNTVVVGFVDDATVASKQWTNLITGWGWLVRDGASYIGKSADMSYEAGGFCLEKAPRTAVGFYKNGSMVLLEIDGEEDILAGPDLFETAELLVSLGVDTAINIDGGGSSVSVHQGTVVSVPTCKDTPEVCERADASITCVKSSL
jgi:exopolysaccharide biosynthesis protein